MSGHDSATDSKLPGSAESEESRPTSPKSPDVSSSAPPTSHPGCVEFSESPEYKAQLRFKMYSHSLQNKINQSRLKRQNEERADPVYQPQVEVLAELVAEGVDFAKVLEEAGVKEARDEVSHKGAAVLATPDGTVYCMDLMALQNVRTQPGQPLWPLDVPFMHWLECVLKARRRLSKAFQTPLQLLPAEPSLSLPDSSEARPEAFLRELHHSAKPQDYTQEDVLAAWSTAESLGNADAQHCLERIRVDGAELLHCDQWHKIRTSCNKAMANKPTVRRVTCSMLLKLVKDD